MSSNTTSQPTTTAFLPLSSNKRAAAVTVGVVGLIMVIFIVVYVLYKKKKREAFRNRPPWSRTSWEWSRTQFSEPTFVHLERKHVQPPQSNPSSARRYRPSRQPSGPSRPPRSPSPELHRPRPRSPPPPPPAGKGLVDFTRGELERATDGFSEDNFLGRGGFGVVHKGILRNGKRIAVKRLTAGSSQGEREFQAELQIISRVHHKHLVPLVGYCTSETRILVLEFVPNKTLEFHLHGQGRPVMTWPVRLRIALGAARGLAYLHEDCRPKVIHRDIKAANILLDDNFEAMVADFGLSRIIPDFNTHVSTFPKGTPGYWPPEYLDTNKVTEKVDVYSFGVVLLELITGCRPLGAGGGGSLVQWARPLLMTALKDGKFDTLVDQRLQNSYNYDEMACMVVCAAASVHDAFTSRPPMSQVLRVLEGTLPLSALNDGTKPRDSNVYSSHGSSDYKSANSTLGLDNTTNDI